jgi:uncharacterized protein (DUF2141 family)
MKRALMALAALPLIGAAAPTGNVEVRIEGLRNSRGVIQACLGRDPRFFPDCSNDPAAFKLSAAAATPFLRFTGVAPGRYALTLFHDENANNRLDMLLGIPREGFGFSRNPKVRFGAPKFRQVDIEVGPTVTRQSIKVQYVL